ncbi:hypothetical protein D3C71_25370 [compost metagenome]
MFRFALSVEARARLAAEAAEVQRLYGLQNPWLAAALLKLARQARQEAPEHRPFAGTYDSRLVWGIVPELARRLGPVQLQANEVDQEIRALSDRELRVRTGHTLRNIAHGTTPAWALLTRVAANGNPVVMAVDRLCPGTLGDREDPLVRDVEEVARYRGTPFQGTWTPAVLTA